MGASVVSPDLSKARIKKDAFRDGLEKFRQRCSSLMYLSLQWKDLDDHYNAVHEALERKSEELRLREGSLREIYLDVVAKQEEFRLMEQMIDDRCKELDLQAADLGEKHRLAIQEKGREIERVIESRLENIEAKEKNFESKSLLVHRLIDERFKVVEGKEKQLVTREKEVIRQSEQLEQKYLGLEVERANLNERLREVNLREVRHEERVREFELEFLEFDLDSDTLSMKLKEAESKNEQADLVLRDLDLRSKELEVRSGELESERKRFDLDSYNLHEQLKAVELMELKEKQVNDKAKELELKNKNLDARIEELELDRRLFNSDRCKLDEQHREFEAEKIKFESQRKKFEVLVGEVVSLNEENNKSDRELELGKKQLETFPFLLVIFLPLLQFWLKRARQLADQRKDAAVVGEGLKLQGRHNEVDKVHGSSRISTSSSMSVLVNCSVAEKTDVPSVPTACSDICFQSLGFEPDQQLSLSIHQDHLPKGTLIEDIRSTSPKAGHTELQNSLDIYGEGLRSLLRGDVEDKLVQNHVSTMLKSLSNPEDRVLCLIQCLHSCTSVNDGSSSVLGTLVKGSILLLKELKTLTFNLDPQLHERAKQFSKIYESCLKTSENNFMGVICFLQFLDVYEVPHDADEIISLLDHSFWRKELPESCNLLGLQGFIPDFLRSLIKKNQMVNAVKYIYAMELESNFSVASIMKDSEADILLKLQNCPLSVQVSLARFKQRRILDIIVDNICVLGLLQIQALDMKINAAREAIQFISRSTVGSLGLTKEFEEYIKNAEKQKLMLDLEYKEAKPGVGSKRAVSECSQPLVEGSVANRRSTMVTSSASSTWERNSTVNSQQPWKKRKLDRNFVPPPLPNNRPMKPWYRHDFMGPYARNFMGPYARNFMGPY
ncbi:hypothetical protein SAY86_016442 [Trapa natans]|uniref:FRIGIDA-like protein n=1 Tax=Trapa natans TaxID=22666 RepID=A0AAN7LC88_TRANT|nr:hypothetical protein SAY86_016442 [Trapa natans]